MTAALTDAGDVEHAFVFDRGLQTVGFALVAGKVNTPES